jgi:type II secretory pathway pseudopilin PulG
MKYVIIVLAVIGLIAILGLTAFGMQMTSKGKLDQLDNRVSEQEEKNKTLNNQSNSASQIAATNMKRGDQGPPGIQGPPGPTGGVHSGAGPLLCVGQKMVATPTTGTSPYSIIYLDNRRYTPIQYWTMRNNPDGTVSVVNKFTGNCMTTDNLGSIYSDTCGIQVPTNQKFNWGPNMQLSSASKLNYCISVDNFARNTSNSNNSYDLDNLTEKRDSNNGTVAQLKLMPCSASQNLDQTWWIGN